MTKKGAAILVVLIAIAFIMVFLSLLNSGNKKNEISIEPVKIIAQETADITAKEAIEIGYNEAKKSITEPLFIRLNSTDSNDNPTIESGTNGKRNAWYISFGNQGTKVVSYLIVNRTIEETHLDDVSELYGSINLEPGLHKASDLMIDSDEAVKIAIERKDLRPGDPARPEDWLIGYHFQIVDVEITPNEINKRLVIIVSGISPNGHLANVTIDQKTSDILGAGEQVGYDQTGHSLWEPF